MAYPMGLPEWDIVRMLLHDDDGAVLESLAGADYFDPATATLWCAGKEFHRDQTVADRSEPPPLRASRPAHLSRAIPVALSGRKQREDEGHCTPAA